MDPLTFGILEIAKSLRIPPETAAVMIPLIIIMGNRAARMIPDTATGPLKWVRIAFAIIGLHVKDNSGVPAVIDTAGAVIRRAPLESVPEDVQGVLELGESSKVRLFDRAAAAVKNRDN